MNQPTSELPRPALKDETVTSVHSDSDPEQNTSQSEIDEGEQVLSTRKALWAWIILCFSTGPTNGMVNQYVTASIQAAANAVGRVPGTDKPCATRGNIQCVVKFGGTDIDYLSYLLYLRAISRAVEGVVSIFTAGLADFSGYRKTMMMLSIYLFGAVALPFAGLTTKSYPYLNALSTLYVIINAVSGLYTVTEASYIPIFMRTAGLERKRQRLDDAPRPSASLLKGSKVSVLGLVAGNVGALVALLIGVIITYTRGNFVQAGYFNFLLAITIGGCLTILFGAVGHYMLPSIPGRKRPDGVNLLILPCIMWYKMFRSLLQYPEAFKLCIGWVLWNTGYSNFLQLLGALFFESTGLDRGSGTYTVYSFMLVVFACMGSLSWLFAFPYTRLHIKSWAYCFLVVNIICVFWGCLGISKNVPIGYKYQAEFWVAIFLFMSTSSALRSLNRVMFASIIPRGSEALFFGLEITLDLATGWVNPLVQAVIQNRTGNLRYPMLPNLFVMLVALGLYLLSNVDKGMEDARKPLHLKFAWDAEEPTRREEPSVRS